MFLYIINIFNAALLSTDEERMPAVQQSNQGIQTDTEEDVSDIKGKLNHFHLQADNFKMHLF